MAHNFEWQYDEIKQIGTDYNNLDEVKKYDERMSKFRDIKTEITEILESTNLKKEHTFLEFGCGTGELSIEASKRCKKVYAVDVSRTMLEYARQKAKSNGCNNIEFVNAGFLNYNHSGEKVNVIVSQLALHHLPDFWKQIALKNIFDIMAEGGKFFLRDIVFSISLDKYQKTIDYTINHFKELAGDETAGNFINHIKNEYSTYDWIMEEMIYRTGLNIEKAEYKDDFISIYVCTKPVIAKK